MNLARKTGARAAAALPALVLCTLLSACALLSSKPQAPVLSYMLDVATVGAPVSGAPPPGQQVLLVEMPHAAPGYDSARMVYVRQPLTQEVFANSVWADTPARLLAPLLVRQLQQSGLFRAVLLAPSAAKSSLRLDSTILRLQQDFQHRPSSVRFSLQLTLMDNSTREVLAWRTVDVAQNAPSEDAAGGAQAAQAAVQQGLEETTAFLQGALAALPLRAAGCGQPVCANP